MGQRSGIVRGGRAFGIVGGSPYGASTIAGGRGERQPSEKDLAGARYQGRRVAEIADQLVRR